jgi:hypothetical protein
MPPRNDPYRLVLPEMPEVEGSSVEELTGHLIGRSCGMITAVSKAAIASLLPAQVQAEFVQVLKGSHRGLDLGAVILNNRQAVEVHLQSSFAAGRRIERTYNDVRTFIEQVLLGGERE